jgi:hypothetical protein
MRLAMVSENGHFPSAIGRPIGIKMCGQLCLQITLVIFPVLCLLDNPGEISQVFPPS